MIAQITGKLIHKALPWIVLEIEHGEREIQKSAIGYEIQIPMTTAYKLPEVGQFCTLFTHLVVREDAHELCGFASRSERDLFRILLKANGIGPKSALGILSGMDAPTFVQSVLNENISLLTSIPGIGKKTAERLLIDLKDKLQKWDGISASQQENQSLAGVGDDLLMNISQQTASEICVQEAIEALQALGYRESEIRAVLKKCTLENTIDPINPKGESKKITTESLIKQVLRMMVR
jgi:Holliday junction DNA helicase RuvA